MLSFSLSLALVLCQEAAPALEVFLVDASGGLLVEGWHVHCRSESDTRVGLAVHADSGSARFEGTTGRVQVHARHRPTGDELRAVTVDVAASGTTVCRLTSAGPPPHQSLFLAVDVPFPRLPPEVVALDAANEVVAALKPEPCGRFVARGVPPGTYRVEVRDPRYRPELFDRLPTGVLGVAQWQGSADLAVRFVDAEDGRVLTPSRAMLAVVARSGVARAEAGVALDPGGSAVSVLPGGTIEVEALFDEHLPVRSTAPALSPGEARELVIRVGRAVEVAGRVCDPAGAGLHGVLVTSPFAPVDLQTPFARNARVDPDYVESWLSWQHTRLLGSGSPSSTSRLLPPLVHRVTETDATGAFRLTGLPPGTREVCVCLTPWHVRSLLLGARAEPCAPLVAAQRGAADVRLELLRPLVQESAALVFALQIGDGPWIGPAEQVAPLTGDGETITLRGLPSVPCRLQVARPSPLPGVFPQEAVEVEFVPSSGDPTKVTLDLRNLQRR